MTNILHYAPTSKGLIISSVWCMNSEIYLLVIKQKVFHEPMALEVLNEMDITAS